MSTLLITENPLTIVPRRKGIMTPLTESNCKELLEISGIVTVIQNTSLSSFCVSDIEQSLPFNQPSQKEILKY